ncbi:uncharacterized protein EDB93DRAFT_401587 [Suillus bovinus]|uniref:uncharacterized protein n=1 Tax=Suillus bovinus TaxID=48563 RepID=UPI001B85C800|nr:uncharacterized protein EDB93DRAFT_401587 [Suillus bovinus]KAG2147735.1 hypothetical protein EDB93DRAFT_401587 [Suillus bovinus]
MPVMTIHKFASGRSMTGLSVLLCRTFCYTSGDFSVALVTRCRRCSSARYRSESVDTRIVSEFSALPSYVTD